MTAQAKPSCCAVFASRLVPFARYLTPRHFHGCWRPIVTAMGASYHIEQISNVRAAILCPHASWCLILVFCWVRGTVINIILLLYPCQSKSIPVDFAGIVLGHIIVINFHQGGALRGNKTCSAADNCICFIAFDLVGVTKGDRINISKGKKIN